jgi:hypothetical protein
MQAVKTRLPGSMGKAGAIHIIDRVDGFGVSPMGTGSWSGERYSSVPKKLVFCPTELNPSKSKPQNSYYIPPP